MGRRPLQVCPLNAMKVLLLSDKSWYSRMAGLVLEAQFDVVTCQLSVGMPLPLEAQQWRGDLIVSFKSDILVPSALLKRASRAAINFHPSPPSFRGLGGYFHAERMKESHFGVTCHHMVEKVDSGPIVDVSWFSRLEPFRADELYHFAGAHSLIQLSCTIYKLCVSGELGLSGHEWGGSLNLRKHLADGEEGMMQGLEASRPTLDALRIIQAANVLRLADRVDEIHSAFQGPRNGV